MIDTLISVIIFFCAVKKMLDIQTATIIDFTIISFGFTYGLVPIINSRLGGGLQFSDTITLQYGIGIFLFISGMYFVSYIAPFKSLKEQANIVPEDTKTTWIVFFLVSVVRLVLALEYGSFANLGNGVDAQTGYFQLFYCLEMMFSLALWILLAKCVLNKKNLLLEALFMLELFFVFAKGRRATFVFFCLFVIFFRFSKRWRDRGLYEYLGISVCGLIVLFLLLVFQPLRAELGEQRIEYGNSSFLLAAERILDSDPADIINADSSNIKERDPIYAFHKRIIESQQTQSPLYGDALLASFVVLTPSFLYFENIDKVNSKLAIQRGYGMLERDTASSWPATGQADFGLLGTFLYGCLFSLILKFFDMVSWKLKGSIIGISSLGALFYVAGNVEEGPEEVFGMIRNLAIFSVLIIVTRYILRLPSSYD